MTFPVQATGDLTPAQYDAAEAAAKLELSNRMIEAFAPAAFNVTSYPTHIDDPRALWRYIDVMQEMRGASHELLRGLTAQEFALFQRAVRFMVQLTREKFGRPLHCQNALFRALSIFRYIKAANPGVVLELGPGSGYVGLLCILDGIGLIACDNTQAFYLTQNLVWKAAAGAENFIDLAQTGDSLRDVLAADLTGKTVHVPWWKILDMEPASLGGNVSLVTANHCLAEMNQNARKYFLRLAGGLLKGSGRPFVFEGWGASYLNSQETVIRDFLDAGFGLAHFDDQVTAFLPSGAPGRAAPLPLPVAPHRRVRNLLRHALVLPPIDYGFRIADYGSNTGISAVIRTAQTAHAAAPKVPKTEIDAFIGDAYGVRPAYLEDQFLAMLDE